MANASVLDNLYLKRSIGPGRMPAPRGYKKRRRDLMTQRSIWEPAPQRVPPLLVETNLQDADEEQLAGTRVVSYIHSRPFPHVYRVDVPWLWKRPHCDSDDDY